MNMAIIVPVCSILYFLHFQIRRVTSADEDDQLNNIVDDVWMWRMADNPRWAVQQGYSEYNNKADNYSIALFDIRKEKADTYIARLEKLNRNVLSAKNRATYDILLNMLNTFVEGYGWRWFSSLNPINFLEGIHTRAEEFIRNMKMSNILDFQDYISFLEMLPLQLRENIDRMRTAIELKHTSNNVSVYRVPEMIEALLVDNARHSVFYTVFQERLDDRNFTTIEKNMLRKEAAGAVQKLIKAYRKLKTFLENEYMPHTRRGYGVGSFGPEGKEFYKSCLKWHLSTDLSPENVHELGKSEVLRIHKEMKNTVNELGFNGSLSDFFLSSKDDVRFRTTSKDTLLGIYETSIQEIRPKMHSMFRNYPDYDIRLQPMDRDQGFGMYRMTEENNTNVGIFYVNLLNPSQTDSIDGDPLIDFQNFIFDGYFDGRLYSIKALTVHETVPGHHLQISYELDAGLSTFRRVKDNSKYFQVPFHFPFYTAYAEGWALYAEFLGEEMGLYKDKYELMGRYVSEIFRATRLVVDTGIHYYGWSKEEAIDYILKYTGYERGQVEFEVDRYITWPGQACAYKIGELKLKELRRKAEQIQGDNFDIKDFHAVILENGGMPLSLLERNVDDWIKHVQSSTSSVKFNLTTTIVTVVLLFLVDNVFTSIG